MSQTNANTGEIARQHNLDALTGLRFWAALAVFATHYFYIELWVPHLNPAIISIHNSLHLAVYVFFILSGFILTIAYEPMESYKTDWSARKKFWIARFARMYPVYLLSLLWFAPFILGHRFAVEPSGLALRKSLAAGLSALFLVQSWISDRFGISWNGPTWTLSVEAGFYLAFPWLLRGLIRLRAATLITLAVFACLIAGWVLSAPSILVNHLQSPFTCMPVFILGILAARLYQQWHSLPSARFAKILPIPALLVMLALASHQIPSARLLPNTALILSMVLLIYGLASQGWPSSLLSTPTMMLLGEASYSLYLLQFPMFYTASWIWLRFPSRDMLTVALNQVPFGHFWGAMVLFALNLIVALVMFLYVERPMRAMLRKRLGMWFVRQALPKPAIP